LSELRPADRSAHSGRGQRALDRDRDGIACEKR
jgi:hypothetical protein